MMATAIPMAFTVKTEPNCVISKGGIQWGDCTNKGQKLVQGSAQTYVFSEQFQDLTDHNQNKSAFTPTGSQYVIKETIQTDAADCRTQKICAYSGLDSPMLYPKGQEVASSRLGKGVKTCFDLAGTSNRRIHMTTDPVMWSVEQVRNWLLWCTQEYNLHDLDINKFENIDGSVICKYSTSELCRLTSPYIGEILMSHLTFLRTEADRRSFDGACSSLPGNGFSSNDIYASFKISKVKVGVINELMSDIKHLEMQMQAIKQQPMDVYHPCTFPAFTPNMHIYPGNYDSSYSKSSWGQPNGDNQSYSHTPLPVPPMSKPAMETTQWRPPQNSI
ncbi:unnamed protein product, partial [Owenia fusiformis]